MKMRKICGLHDLFKIHTNIFKLIKYLPEVSLIADSALLCSENVWFRSKNARFCSKIFLTYARDRSVIAWHFAMLEMLDHFSARDSSDPKFKIKNCDWDRSDRKFQCSKRSRSMFLPLDLNSSWHSDHLLQFTDTYLLRIIHTDTLWPLTDIYWHFPNILTLTDTY